VIKAVSPFASGNSGAVAKNGTTGYASVAWSVNPNMAASHSPLLIALYAVIEAARHGHVWGDLKRRSASPAKREQYQADHRAIVTALLARDPAGAVEAMRLHLARVAGDLNACDPAAGVTWR
jgi:hypothetical protein